MRITESRLRKIIKEEITRKLLLEEATFEKLVSAVKSKKLKDPDSLSDLLQRWVKAGGDKDELSDEGKFKSLKDEFKAQGGDEGEIDTLAKKIVNGKMQVVGDMAGAAAKAADVLGEPSIADDLKTAVNALKGGKDFESLPLKSKVALGKIGSGMITQDAQKTMGAANILRKVGEKT